MEITADSLPPSARDIVALIGLPATLRLIDSDGGLRTFVPMNLPQDHRLVKLLGMENAVKLAREYGGAEIEVPRVPLRRHAALIADFIAGKSYSQCAAAYGMTIRNVKYILAAHGTSADDRQLELF